MGQTPDVQQMNLQKLHTMQRELKKAHAHVRTIMRVKALIAVYKGMPPETVAECYEISLKSLKKWMKQFEADDDLADHARSGRPPKLSPEQAQQLKDRITTQNQRVWTARHVSVLITVLWHVSYSVEISTVAQLQQRFQEHEEDRDQAEWAEARAQLNFLFVVQALGEHDAPRALALAQQTLQELPADATDLRRLAALCLDLAQGAAHRLSGDFAAAERVLIEAGRHVHATDYHLLNLVAMANLTEMYEQQHTRSS